jgi:hypothetical protein
MRSNAQVMQPRTQDMSTVVDVDEIHTPKYDPTSTQVEEEQNPSQEAKHPEEDAERIESDASRGKGPQQEEQAMGSAQQGLEPEEEQENGARGCMGGWGVIPMREEESLS